MLDLIHQLVCEMKVPHKAKRYEQKYVRTMFFDNVLIANIDGQSYEITKETKVHIYNCAENLQGIVDRCFAEEMSMNCDTPEKLTGYKKQMTDFMKKFDKLYTQHIKVAHPTIDNIHKLSMKNINDLIESNLNLHYFELLRKDNPSLPDFRHQALETKFAENLTTVCYTLTGYGNIRQHYDIKRMLDLMKLKDWK